MNLSAAIRATLVILLALGLTAVPALGKEKPRKSQFTATFDAFQKLSADPGAPREQWIRVIRSFAAINKAEKSSPTGNRSLFLAGRACLALYRRSGSKQDLDEAIRHLNEFLRSNRHGPYRILGLQELKEAHLLKRKLAADFGRSRSNDDQCPGQFGPTVGVQPGRQNLHELEPGKGAQPRNGTVRQGTGNSSPVGISPVQPRSAAPTAAASSRLPIAESTRVTGTDPAASAMVEVAPPAAVSSPPLYNCTGNPFFGKQRLPPTGSPGSPTCASLPPRVTTDVPRANPAPPVQSPTVTERKPEPISTPVIPEAALGSTTIASNAPPPPIENVEDTAALTAPALEPETQVTVPGEQSNCPESRRDAREKKLPLKGPVIVIDPGHGGRDPGAVSHDGLLKEKGVTLRIATTVKKLLEQRIPNATVALTRTADNFLALQERTAFANSLNADLFISVHCNAAEDASSRGIETYYLSKASSTKAMASAARENGISPDKMSDIDATLLDLLVASKKVESVKLAESVHSSLIRAISGTAPSRRDRGVKRAPFYVLLGAKMPAILIECGFINGRETENLKKSSFLDTMAEGIADGTIEYLHGLGGKL